MHTPYTGYYAPVVSAYTGHLNPVAALGRELQRRGHRVAFLSELEAERQVQKVGLEFLVLKKDA